MKVLSTHKWGIAAVVAGVCLVGAAVGTAQRQADRVAVRATDARELSSVFRQVARDALPSIVSIETRGKLVRRSQQSPFGEDSPFREFFEDDPRFRDFFRQLPQTPEVHPRGMGSGFIIDTSGIILTNNHVVEDAEVVTVRLHDGREFTATEVKTDPRSDVAVIRIDAPKDLVAIPLGDSDRMEVGDWVLAIGSPFGLDMSVTAGIVSAKGRGPRINEREDYIQTDAAINPGNSGGPLVNLDGEVVGINTAISSRSGGYDGVSFAIPANMANWAARQLIAHGQVKRAYLGVSMQPIDSDLAANFGVAVGEGALVNQVLPESPAADAKLQTGDVILELAGQQAQGPRSMQAIVERLEIGKTYEAVVLRDGKRIRVPITFREMPKNYSLNELRPTETETEEPSEVSHDELGLEVQDLTDELAEQLGFEGVEGVVIKSVESGSPSHIAGLRAGQVIEKVGNRRVRNTEEFQKAVENASLKKGVLLFVRVRGGATQFVVVKAD